MSPSDSNVFNVVLNTFGDISGSALDISLNLKHLYSPSIDRISNPHFVLKWDSTLRIGQCCRSEYFCDMPLSIFFEDYVL